MDTPRYGDGVTIRTLPASRKALARVVAGLKNSETVKFFGGRPTQEAIINASWLYLESLDEETLEVMMAEYLGILEAAMRKEPPVDNGAKEKPPASGADEGLKKKRKMS
jgi:hypothetical protein